MGDAASAYHWDGQPSHEDEDNIQDGVEPHNVEMWTLGEPPWMPCGRIDPLVASMLRDQTTGRPVVRDSGYTHTDSQVLTDYTI